MSQQSFEGTGLGIAGCKSVEKVPKIIHYCWFGGGELPVSAKKTLASWERFAPGYEIRRCDESVFDVSSCDWTRKAYEARRYAFVADYARFRMIFDHGGVYMDLGSELVRDITTLIERHSPLSAIEEYSKTVNSGLIVAAPAHNPTVSCVLARYEAMSFEDDPEFLRRNTVNEVFTTELERLGYFREDMLQTAGGWTFLPSSAFNPVYGFGGYHIKKDTYSIHRFSGSWVEPELKVKQSIVRVLSPLLGRRAAQVIGRTVGELKTKGLRNGVASLFRVAHVVMARRQK